MRIDQAVDTKKTLSTINADDLVNITHIRAAAQRIAPYAVITPLLESWSLNDRVGGRVLVKAESMQRTGAFKFRGAVNRLACLTDAELLLGVLAYSSGNHAQAIALAARLFHTKAVIVMPEDAPRVKMKKTIAWGAEVVTYDRYTGDRAEIGRWLAMKRGLILVPPYDDPIVIAGQGTLGLEVIEQAAKMNAKLDGLLIPCSGGGLTAGCVVAFQDGSPRTAIYAVEPEHYDDTRRSLAAGQRVANTGHPDSICDAILADKPGELTFRINQKGLTGGLVVTDREALAAVAYAWEEFKLVIEPGGAVALAAVLSGKIDCKDRVVAVVCSGGNMDASTFAKALELSE